MKKLTRIGRLFVIAAGTSLVLGNAHANCYTVYKADARVYHSQTSPVDASLPYSESVPARFGPGAMMIVTPGALDCPSENELRGSDTPAGSLFTKDAEAMANAKALSGLAARHSGRDDDGTGDSSVSVYSGGGQPFPRGPILTGPRGGQYYVNGNGNRTYVSGGGSRRR